MMVVGVTLLNVSPGAEREIYDDLRGRSDVREVLHVFGEYDFITIVEVEGLSRLNDIVDDIRELEGVVSTQTIIGAEMP
ncbi:MAG: Lrp/AsnC family C-terminal domain [Candidatus Methanohalarchaeum thermophilum]|uniref:Lrp/AsnC family C-terminal domain n=1 Tax=Methanohalarchaeum thermophilum TaxID=1903181 RepID=A0A1Q6DUA6_METT1|nr:MAG: Lrp/AsnC family C-terminal domain [Candidatus Methanohalarchaeum thermophilum]